VGVILVVIGITSTVGKGVFTGPVTQRWGEAAIIKGSMLASSLGFVVLLLASSYPTVLLATGLFILSKTFLRTSLLSLASRQTNSGDMQDRRAGQGEVMGLCNSFVSIGRIAGPIWAGFIFDVNACYPYLSGAVIMFTGFLIGLAQVSRASHGISPQLWRHACR
jgi:DHA1 family multidrug resistance protein-like MFS transporter